MKELAEMLKQYLEQNPLDYGSGESVLDILYWYHMEHDHWDSEKIRDHFESLRKLVNFPPKEYDQVYYVVSDLCLEHGRLAFGEGIKTGISLSQELND